MFHPNSKGRDDLSGDSIPLASSGAVSRGMMRSVCHSFLHGDELECLEHYVREASHRTLTENIFYKI